MAALVHQGLPSHKSRYLPDHMVTIVTQLCLPRLIAISGIYPLSGSPRILHNHLLLQELPGLRPQGIVIVPK